MVQQSEHLLCSISHQPHKGLAGSLCKVMVPAIARIGSKPLASKTCPFPHPWFLGGATHSIWRTWDISTFRLVVPLCYLSRLGSKHNTKLQAVEDKFLVYSFILGPKNSVRISHRLPQRWKSHRTCMPHTHGGTCQHLEPHVK